MNQADLTCPNCDVMMYCEVEVLLGDKFRTWTCEKCGNRFRLVADQYIEFAITEDELRRRLGYVKR